LAGERRARIAGGNDDGGSGLAGSGQPDRLVAITNHLQGDGVAQVGAGQCLADEYLGQLTAVEVRDCERRLEVKARPAEGQGDEAGQDKGGHQAHDVGGAVAEALAKVLAGDDQGGARCQSLEAFPVRCKKTVSRSGLFDLDALDGHDGGLRVLEEDRDEPVSSVNEQIDGPVGHLGAVHPVEPAGFRGEGFERSGVCGHIRRAGSPVPHDCPRQPSCLRRGSRCGRTSRP
jgi:hypothetical protein